MELLLSRRSGIAKTLRELGIPEWVLYVLIGLWVAFMISGRVKNHTAHNPPAQKDIDVASDSARRPLNQLRDIESKRAADE